MTRAEKEAFKKRMAAGRRKAAKARNGKNPGKKKPKAKAKAKKKKSVTRRPKKNRAKSQKRSVTRPVKRKAGKSQNHRKNSRRNQEPGSIEGATKLYEQFHGKPPANISEYEYEQHYREHFAELGKLVELRVFLDEMNPDFEITRFGNAKVVATPDGANIYFIGGDQSIDLAALNIATDKDYVELGPCTYISYFTVKGFHDFEPTTYWHEFGEEDDCFPGLVYDRLNKSLFLTSGNYRVRPEGIVN